MKNLIFILLCLVCISSCSLSGKKNIPTTKEFEKTFIQVAGDSSLYTICKDENIKVLMQMCEELTCPADKALVLLYWEPCLNYPLEVKEEIFKILYESHKH
jgi:hypothetical protein